MINPTPPVPWFRTFEGLAGAAGWLVALLLFGGFVVTASLVPESSPLRYPVPQVVDVPHAVGVLPEFRPGESVPTLGVKCNDSDEVVSVSGRMQLRRVDPAGLPPIQLIGSLDPETGEEIGGGIRSLPPRSCIDLAFANEIPRDTPPGVYVFEGFEWVVESDGSRGDRAVWFTEEFRVL